MPVLERAALVDPELVGIPLVVPVHLVNGLEGARRVLQENQANYIKGLDYQRMRPVLGEGLLTANGETWRTHRRMIQPAFHHKRLSSFGAQMLAGAERMLARWRNLPADQVIDLHQEMMRLTLEILGRALFSSDMGPFVDAIGGSVGVLLSAIDQRVNHIVAWPTWIPTPFNRRLMRQVRVLEQVVSSLVEARQKNGGPEDDLLGMLLAAKNEDGSPGLSPSQLRDEIITVILAGHETTANALSFAFHLLAHHPAERGELEEACRGVQLGPEDLGKVPLLRWTIDEAMRLYPPAWAVARQAVASDRIAGYEIRAGSIVLVAPWTLHRDPRFWEEPLRFRPRRFSEERPDALAFMPFGAGPRMCIGKGFAMMELELVLARILEEVEVISLAPRDLPLEPTITLRPKGGLPARLRWRT